VIAEGVEVAHVTGTGGDAVLGGGFDQGGVVVPGPLPGLWVGEVVVTAAGVGVTNLLGVFPDEGGHVGIHEHVVLLGGDLGGEQPGDGTGKSEARLEGVDAGDGVRVAFAGGERVHEVEFAFEIEGGALPAGGGERGGVAGVLGLGLAADREEDVHVKEGQQQDREENQQQENDDLPGPVLPAGAWKEARLEGRVQSPASSI